MKKYLFIIAILMTGLLGGLAAVVFKYSIEFVHDFLFLNEISFIDDARFHTAIMISAPMIIMIPVLGSFLVTFLIKHFAPDAQGHGVPEVMFSIQHNNSTIRPQVALVKAITSSVSIGSGGSSGAEGPIVQIASALGSIHSLYIKNLSEIQKATLVACGASAGLAATFNAPLSGILFTIELLLPVIALHTIIPVIGSTVIAVFIAQLVISPGPFFLLNITSVNHTIDLGRYILLGCITGLASVCFITTLIKFEKFFDNLKYNPYLKHAGGMFLVGIILYIMEKYTGHYYVSGAGEATMYDLFDNKISSYSFLILLFGVKLLATCLTLGSGASGGVFSPALFMGANLGGCYYILTQNIYPTIETHPLNFVIAGMVGMVGGTTGAVLTAVVILLETTHCYYLAIPLLLTVCCSSAIKQLIIKKGLYHIKLNEKVSKLKNLGS